jgi:hypothetical protein
LVTGAVDGLTLPCPEPQGGTGITAKLAAQAGRYCPDSGQCRQPALAHRLLLTPPALPAACDCHAELRTPELADLRETTRTDDAGISGAESAGRISGQNDRKYSTADLRKAGRS